MKILWSLFLVLVTTGCSSTNISQLIDSLSKDPAANCIVISTPYGSALVARATPGVKLNLAGGTCSIEAAPLELK